MALALCALGVLLRPNALIAAPILCAYVIWPFRTSLRRTALLLVPAMLGLFALVQVVYYGVLGATRQHPLQTIMVFDLGGISHFSKENQFPVDWSEAEATMLLNDCYQPTQWDIYWKRFEPCDFVMRKIEREKGLFGTPVITDAWVHAILQHPLAYLRHRAAFMWNFLTGDNLTMWLADVENPTENVFPDRASFVALVALHDRLKSTPLFSVGAWLLVCLVACALAWRRRETPEGAFTLGVCGSAIALCADLRGCRRRVGFPLWLLGRAGRDCGQRRRCARPDEAACGRRLRPEAGRDRAGRAYLPGAGGAGFTLEAVQAL